jgi:tripartite ATP-independent transporter DctM subunit
MTELFIHNMAPIMFGVLVVLLLMGFPVAFALAANGVIFGLIGIELGLLQPALLQALPQRVFGIVTNDTLLAIPFFTFMGLILERSGMAEDLLDTIGQLFGKVRGGVAIAVVLVGSMLAATTGVVAASVISMGLISLPLMLRYGYDRKFASGVIMASGTLAQIVPPSLVLIVLSDQLGKSVGDMYQGAFIPAFLLIGLYILFIVGLSIFRPNTLPALPPEALKYREPDGSSGLRSLAVLAVLAVGAGYAFAQWFQDGTAGLDVKIVLGMIVGITVAFVLASAQKMFGLKLLSTIAERTTFVLIPPLLLIFLVLGTIFIGLATPTEAGAMGAVGALVLALVRRRMSWSLLKQAMDSTTKLSCFVMFILIGATVFTLSFRGVSGDLWVEELFLDLPGDEWGFLIAVTLLVFVLGFFLDFFEIAFVIIPLVAPVANKLGIDLIWFGVILAMNMQTSFLTPPFGFALFYLRSVAPSKDYKDQVTGQIIPAIKTGEIYRGSIPFIIIMLIAMASVMLFPQMVMHYKDGQSKVDPSTVEILLPGDELLDEEAPAEDEAVDPLATPAEEDAEETMDPAKEDLLRQLGAPPAGQSTQQ